MKNRDIIRITILGTVVCLIFSLYFFKAAEFDLYQLHIYFVVMGLAGSVTLALLLANRLRDTLYINILIYIIFVVIVYGVVNKPRMAVILLLYMLGLWAAVWVYVRMFEPRLTAAVISRPLVLAGLGGLFFIIVTLIQALIYIHKINRGFVLTNMPVGFFLGLGIGIGRELKEKYWNGAI